MAATAPPPTGLIPRPGLAPPAAAATEAVPDTAPPPVGPVVVVGPDGVPSSIDTADHKTILNTWCQRYTRKVISKQDVLYESSKFGQLCQATVTLNCVGGIKYAGDLARTVKQAEQNAARVALDDCQKRLTLPPPVPKKKNKKSGGGGGGGEGGEGKEGEASKEPQEPNARMQLNTALMRILKQPMKKEDVTADITQTALGFQCRLTLPCLPEKWATLTWAGEVASTKKMAQENAARHAVVALREDPELGPVLSPEPGAKPSPVGQTSGGAGGGGKKKRGSAPAAEAGAPVPRERVMEQQIMGDLVEWKKNHGWIILREPIEHPKAGMNKGRVYLHLSDWLVGEEGPQAGTVIRFHLYVDDMGLGAEQAVFVPGVAPIVLPTPEGVPLMPGEGAAPLPAGQVASESV